MSETTVDILLVEDNPAWVRLTQEAFKGGKLKSVLRVAKDGVDAMAVLRRTDQFADAARPDLILLDLNLPRKDGREVLAEVKSDPDLKRIPVVILTTSRAEKDIVASYNLHANCYIVKPADLDGFLEIVEETERFWLSTVTRSPQ